MISREEHLAWAKRRALEYVDMGDPTQGFTSMLSDMGKHPELENHPGNAIGVGFMLLPGWIDNRAEVRRWIEGFR